jgi:hypothetical protein
MQKSKQEIWAKNHVVLSWHLVRWSIVKVLSGVLIMARTLYRPTLYTVLVHVLTRYTVLTCTSYRPIHVRVYVRYVDLRYGPGYFPTVQL